MSEPHARWLAANQRYLMAAVRQVTEALDRHVSRAEGRGVEPEAERAAAHALEQARADMPGASALEIMSDVFGLSAFERQVLLLCAGVELDGSAGGRCAAAHGDSRRPYPTFGLALAALAGAHWSAVTPGAPLRHWRLVEIGGHEALTQAPLRIDERALHYLAGVPHLDERLDGLVEAVASPELLPGCHAELAARIAEVWAAHEGLGRPIVQLCGSDPAAARAIASETCRALGLRLAALRPQAIPAVPSEREQLARLWQRETLLAGRALLVEVEGGESPDPALAFAERVGGAAFVIAREPLALRRWSTMRLDVPRPRASDRRIVWRAALGPLAAALDGELDRYIGQFDLDPAAIRAAAVQARMEAAPDHPLEAAFWSACRAQARTRLEGQAQRVEPGAGWDDLVVPEAQRDVLREIAAQARQRMRVHEEWGWMRGGGRGLGLTALFAGASGTGKTMAAEVLAGALGLDLYRIDLAQVVSKYIGETEKNLRRVFDAAEAGGAVLLFDEADALFGKRSEVRDSHDRYANIEVSYLLQRMESYRGLAILTTNNRAALDQAFLRRLRFVVTFPFPDVGQRAEIWRRVFPAATPTDGLDPARLAGLNVAGGSIWNIALGAAFAAADAGQPVRMTDVVRAARAEYAKLDKSLTASEIGALA